MIFRIAKVVKPKLIPQEEGRSMFESRKNTKLASKKERQVKICLKNWKYNVKTECAPDEALEVKRQVKNLNEKIGNFTERNWIMELLET